MTLKSSSSLSASCLRGVRTDICSKILLLYLCCLTFACIYATAEHNSSGLKDRELARLLSHKNASVGASAATANSTSKNRLRRQHQSYSMNEYGRQPPSVPPPLPPPPPQQPDYSNPQPRPPVELPLDPVANAPAFRAPSAPAPRPIRTTNTTTNITNNNSSGSSNNQSDSSGNALLFGVAQFAPPSYRNTNAQFPAAPLVAPQVIYPPSNQQFGPGPSQSQALSQASQQSQQPQFAPPPSQSQASRIPPAVAPPWQPTRQSSAPQALQSNSHSLHLQKLLILLRHHLNHLQLLTPHHQTIAGRRQAKIVVKAQLTLWRQRRPSRPPLVRSVVQAPLKLSQHHQASLIGTTTHQNAPSSAYLFPQPTGYACCNPVLNDLMVETYTDLEARPKFHTCNINAIAAMLQSKAEQKFNTSFETIAAFEDFAQKIHFNGDLVCKVELGGKYMLAYGSVRDAQRSLPPEEADAGPAGQSLPRSKREALETTAPAFQPFIGPILEQVELPLNHISRRHSMWI
uniref:Ground-like domain-containing protein n=1 Tax=Ditylenchus dipsaci TaxID=166011 RepID=A0A915CMK9_9BILA